MPIGLRGVGKTVLLNRFITDSQNLGFEICSIEAQEDGDLRTALVTRLRKALLSLDGIARSKKAISSLVTKALGVLKSFAMTTPDGHRFSIGVDALVGVADSGELAEDLTDLLISVGEAARDVGSGVLIAIDEIQYLEENELAALITAIHKTTQQDLPVLLVGTGLPSVPGKVGEAKSYAERLFAFPHIGSLDPHDAREAITKPALAQGVKFQNDALDEIYRLTEGYPYFIQEWAYHVWNNATGQVITIDDVVGVRVFVRDALDKNFFLVRLDRLTPSEKDYMKAMAELGRGPHRSADIAEQYGAKMESVSPIRSGLIKKGMIYNPAYGDTAFTVPLFDDFLRRTLTSVTRKKKSTH